jgi:DNA-binding transcriptional ArsR family regulator
MSDYELIPPRRAPGVYFSAEPAYNGLTSLMILNADLSGFGQWVQDTVAALSTERLKTNRLVCDAAPAFLDGMSWPSFPAWIDDLEGRDPYVMRQHSLTFLLERLQMKLGWDPGNMPSPEQLQDDRSTYLDFVARAYRHKGEPADLSYHALEHEYLGDPIGRQALIVDHLRHMWNEHLAREWEQNELMIQESIAAFESVHLKSRTPSEIVSEVTARDVLPRDWETWLPEVEHLVFIPSAHIGPYMVLIDRTGTTARIIFGARVPAGAATVSPALNRSELLTRLGALADDSRLRILELLAREGELGAQQVIARLEMSQSSASRHLRQLVATGYVTERRLEGAKVYSLSPGRLEDTLSHLKAFLR